MKQVDEVYVSDAYNSLSIEGYKEEANAMMYAAVQRINNAHHVPPRRCQVEKGFLPLCIIRISCAQGSCLQIETVPVFECFRTQSLHLSD